jgi:hypothetical protein
MEARWFAYGARLVPGQLHRQTLGHTTPDHVADGGSSQVVRNPTRTAGREARRFPRLVERADRLRLLRAAARLGHQPKEHPRLDLSGLLQPDVLRVLRLQEPAQIIGQGKDAAFAVLRGARVEPDLTRVEIDLSPFEREHFGGDAPPGDVREGDDRLDLGGQVRQDRLELLPFSHELHLQEIRSQLRELSAAERLSTYLTSRPTH